MRTLHLKLYSNRTTLEQEAKNRSSETTFYWIPHNKVK